MLSWRRSIPAQIASLVRHRAGIGSHSQLRHGWIWPTLSSIQRVNFTGKHLLFAENHSGFKSKIQTLAIETSCDDTAVALFSISREAEGARLRSHVLFHEKVTADSAGYNGIHPLIALDSHRRHLGHLVKRAVQKLEPTTSNTSLGSATQLYNSCADPNPSFSQRQPDFVTVTRGPGMRSNLDVGLNIAKGLALAWNVPLVGVNHMQAHALTPRLCATINACEATDHSLRNWNQPDVHPNKPGWHPNDLEPRFPFLGLLVSGGHTMLIESKSLNNHAILADTQDIAVGDYLDKVARMILDKSELKVPYGKALEDFAFGPGSDILAQYQPPRRRQNELETRSTGYKWSLNPPLAQSRRGEKSSRRMLFSFSGLSSSVSRLCGLPASDQSASDLATETAIRMPRAERQELAREVQRVAFEHLASRILLHLDDSGISKVSSADGPPYTVVVSGGVASNKFLRHVLRSVLDVRGYSNIRLLFPPPELCTDNALMIAWAGMEMYDAGYESELSIEPLRKWSVDPLASDGGILGVGGWRHTVTSCE